MLEKYKIEEQKKKKTRLNLNYISRKLSRKLFTNQK